MSLMHCRIRGEQRRPTPGVESSRARDLELAGREQKDNNVTQNELVERMWRAGGITTGAITTALESVAGESLPTEEAMEAVIAHIVSQMETAIPVQAPGANPLQSCMLSACRVWGETMRARLGL